MATLVQTPASYLKLARKCMENAKNMTSCLQFNSEQCVYLANKLKVTIPSAEDWWAQLNTSPEFKSELNSELNSECLEVMKLLHRTAKEVESFIERCRDDNWIQAAMILANMSDLYVFFLGSNLNFCMVIFGHRVKYNQTWESQLGAFSPILNSDGKVYRDQKDLLTRLERVIHSSNLSDEKCQLAKCLSERLRQDLEGSDQLEVWNIDYSNLRHKPERLGSGSAGTVNKSTWLAAGQIEVAEKFFYGSDDPSFMNEVKLLVRLAHPNIVPLLGYAMNQRSCSIVMELMEGDLLALMQKRLREDSTCKFPFTIFESVDLMLQIALGMLYLHRKHVVHRDLKSLNILFKSRQDIDGEHIYVKVTDFGLSKTKETSTTYSNQTMNTGTTRWMAPELMPKDDPLLTTSDHDPVLKYPFKVDVYSFGMVCYEILSGEMPFSKIYSLREVKKMVLNDERPKLPDPCPHLLETLIHECWKREARSRPSFEKICERLKHLKYSLMTVFSSRLNFQAPTNDLIPRQLHRTDGDFTTRRVFTMAECEKHKSSNDCWLVYDGKVYDVTRFLNEHPGGDEVILEVAGGRDATDDFCEIEHSKDALKMMAEFHIGDIDGYIPTDMWVATFTGRCSRSRWRRPLHRVWF